MADPEPVTGGFSNYDEDGVLKIDYEDEDLFPKPTVPLGQVMWITHEVEQDTEDVELFKVTGKDKSWFQQKGGTMFHCKDPKNFRISIEFVGDEQNLYGTEYAVLSMAEQQNQKNWLIMVGIAPKDYELTGYKDCKMDGSYYFLFHLCYRRTFWRIIGCPHYNAELEDLEGNAYTCDPQKANQYEYTAYAGQKLTVEYKDNELWVVDADGEKVLKGIWVFDEDSPYADTVVTEIPREVEYRPVVLTPNSPVEYRVTIH